MIALDGIRCPSCGGDQHRVLSNKNVDDGIRRRRVCQDCGTRWNTLEYSIQKAIQTQKESERSLHDARAAIRQAIAALQQIKI